MKNKLKVVKVNILGQEYSIRTKANPTYFKKVEEYINDKTNELVENGLNQENKNFLKSIKNSVYGKIP